MFEQLKYKLTRYKPRDEKEGIDTNALNDDHMTRSKYYHTYFEGHVERQVWNESKGKYVIERTYVEDYYYRDLETREYRITLLMYYVLCLGSLALFIWGGAQRIEPAYKYIYLPSLPVFFMAVMELWLLVNFSLLPRKLTVYEYHSGSKKLIKCSLALAILMALQSVAFLVYVLFFPAGGVLSAKLICVFANVAASVCMFLLARWEQRAKYLRVENENAHLKHVVGNHLIR